MGQFVGETIRGYGNDFLRLLPLGLPLAIVDQLIVHENRETQALIFWAASPFFVGAYVYACAQVHAVPPTLGAFVLGLLIFAPFPILRSLYILPAVAWFAFIGLAVPASLVERLRFRAALVRGRVLGTSDYVHALGSLATLVLVVGVADITLEALLHTEGGNGARAALFLADTVLSPLLYLGGALLYGDQAARVGSRSADIRPPLDPDPAGRADPEGQP